MTVSLQPKNPLQRVAKDYPVVIVPGLNNSDSNHWQSLWHQRLPTSRRVQLPEWSTPDLAKWKQGIAEALQGLSQPAVIIAHSFGTLASASFAAEHPDKIAALFLVAPADPDKFGITAHLPQGNLPVPSKIIASSNDPWLNEIKAATWALQWGADFLRIRNLGHINSDSQLGIWDQGIEELHYFLRKVKRQRAFFILPHLEPLRYLTAPQ